MSLPSKALAKRKAANELMPPPPPIKRIKRPTKVLDEETYSDALSHIIARDFFPGLLELESQEEYLEALSSKDDSWIESAGRKLTAAMTPRPGRRRGVGFSSSAGDLELMTPFSTIIRKPNAAGLSDGGETNTKPEVDLNLSLNGFLAKYTSEDAESFNKVLDKHNQKKAEKNAWFWNENKIPEPRQIAYRKQQQRLLEAAATEEASDGKVSQSIAGVDARPAGPTTWKHIGKNSLMFRPEGIEDSMQTSQQRSEELSRAAPKKVVYNNTRLPTQFSGAPPADSVPPSPTLSAIKDAIAGRPRIPASEGGYDGNETPRVNGYAFVDSEEPEPEPEPESEPRHKSDWSRISFGEVDTKKNPFSMQESSSREKLHHRMVDKVAQSKRMEKVSTGFKTPVTSTPGRLSARGNATPSPALTPAGHRLLGRLGGSTPLRNATSTGIWDNMKGKTPRGPNLRGLVTPRQ